jgi:putative acetyltransferase
MELAIRRETPLDIQNVSELIKSAFKNEVTNDLVEVLRSRKNFIKELSLVAEVNGVISGYVLLSPIEIETGQSLVNTLWLEPVCVQPKFQNRGIGSALINYSLNKARSMGFESVFVTGEFKYYSRFGFCKAHQYGIHSSLYVPADAFLGMELIKNGLKHNGKLIYPLEIYE